MTKTDANREEHTMENSVCSIKGKIKGQSVIDGAGVKINRIIGSHHLDDIDPFVLLDEIRSTDPDDYFAGFPTHPHRGIETITYMKQGKFRHKDSKGHGGLLSDGCVQWMTAGKGILHSEMPEECREGIWGYQLWLSLPARQKMVEPRYQHLSPDMIPSVQSNGLDVKIISGMYQNVTGPAENWVKSYYFDVHTDRDALFTFTPEKGMNSFIYVHTGSVAVCPGHESATVNERELVRFAESAPVEILGASDKAGFLFLSAFPNNEPIVRGGPFVMNTDEEIEQAFRDYQKGVLG